MSRRGLSYGWWKGDDFWVMCFCWLILSGMATLLLGAWVGWW